jgi:hypothetical protein
MSGNLELSVQINTDIDYELKERFKSISRQVVAFLSTGGMNVQPFRAGLPYFSLLSTLRQQEVVSQLGFFRDLCSEQVKEGYEIKDSKSFTWRALNRLGLTPSSDLFNHFQDEDIIEIYSQENVQIFRNFRYFEFCSFSLEELYSREWFHLYQRDESILPKIGEMLARLQTPEGADGFVPEIPDHIVKEIDSDENLVMDYALSWIAPLYTHKRYAGFILIEGARIHEVGNA